jgi:hypothetical protein
MSHRPVPPPLPALLMSNTPAEALPFVHACRAGPVSEEVPAINAAPGFALPFTVNAPAPQVPLFVTENAVVPAETSALNGSVRPALVVAERA